MTSLLETLQKEIAWRDNRLNCIRESEKRIAEAPGQPEKDLYQAFLNLEKTERDLAEIRIRRFTSELKEQGLLP